MAKESGSVVAAARAFLTSPQPPRAVRLAFASALALSFGFFTLAQFDSASRHSDFGMVWFGARALINGVDPWSAVGPHLAFDYDWRLIYPGTALVAVLPLTPFSERVATALFIGISTWLLAFGITKDGWYRVPIFASLAFISAARLGQWSILFTAAVFLPALAFFSAAKPQAAIPVLAAARTRTAFIAALAGFAILTVSSLLLDPGWPARWLAAARASSYMDPAITYFPGVLVLAVLSKWRRPEAWIILSLAVVPQSWGWYNTLILFTIPASFAEAVILCATTLLGAWFADNHVNASTPDGLMEAMGRTINVTVYLPATIFVLRRKNVGPTPAWLKPFVKRY